MIRFIAIIDEKRGTANEHGMPWHGKTPTDLALFKKKTSNSIVLMGYATYLEFKKPLSNRRNFVASTKPDTLRDGFTLVDDARGFLQNAKEDIWVIGGAGLFTSTLDLANELYITQLEGDFKCTKFFPEFQNDFKLVSESNSITENGITYTFQVWKNKRIP